MKKIDDASAEGRAVSIIVPTMCQAARARLLSRAVESIVDQSGVRVEIIVVVNGDKYDQPLVESLERDSRLRVVRLSDGNVSMARYEGVARATGDYIGFLDDDDELLPGALSARVNLFKGRETVDVVVTNGFEHVAGQDTPNIKVGSAAEILQNPGASLLRQNWFASPASLFRAVSVERESFRFSHRYFEWTYLFFVLLSKGKRFYYDEMLTYRVYKDNPLSISKSDEYMLAYADFLLVLSKLPLEPSIKRNIKEKYVNALNTQASLELAQTKRLRAWRSHLKCLASGGWRYFTFTRFLLMP